MSAIRWWLDASILPTYSRTFAISSPARRASSMYPTTAFIGVRMSWLIEERNALFARSLAATFACATSSASCRRLWIVYRLNIITSEQARSAICTMSHPSRLSFSSAISPATKSSSSCSATAFAPPWCLAQCRAWQATIESTALPVAFCVDRRTHMSEEKMIRITMPVQTTGERPKRWKRSCLNTCRYSVNPTMHQSARTRYDSADRTLPAR